MSKEGPGGEVPHTELPGDQAGRLKGEGYIDSESRVEKSNARQNLTLWIAVLGAAIIWLIQMQTSYSLVVWTCSIQRNWPLHVISACFLVIAAVPGFIAWREWRQAAVGETERESSGPGRRRFMAMLGLMVTAMFLLLIVAQAIPSFFFNPCLE